MSKTSLNEFWLIILSAIWLTSAFVPVDKLSITHSVSYAEVASTTETCVCDIKQGPTLYTYSTHVFWLSLFIDNFFDNTDDQILAWPEQSQFSTLFNIISYQHYIASLRSIFSIN